MSTAKKKTAPKKKAATATSTTPSPKATGKTGKALANFRVDGVFYAPGDEVTLTADQVARYGHRVS